MVMEPAVIHSDSGSFFSTPDVTAVQAERSNDPETSKVVIVRFILITLLWIIERKSRRLYTDVRFIPLPSLSLV